MGEKITVGPINKGLRNDRTAFAIDNDSFPVLRNAYQWRGRVKRKRGTSLLGRLKRYFSSTSASYNSGSTTITLNGSGAGNLLTGFSLQTNGNIVPGSVVITAPGPTVYTDPAMNGTLSPSGTINYATGAIVIAAEAGNAVSAVFLYYPDLPVMGLEEFNIDSNAFPGTIAFDTKYSYNITTAFPYNIYDVSFYKNPPTGLYPGYVQKTVWTPTSWNGQDYQQFWTVNYQGALWATNGINVPFSVSNVGMQYKRVVAVLIVTPGPPATVTLQITAHGLVVGDFIYLNEFSDTVITGINFQTAYVIAVLDVNDVTVELPNGTLGGPSGLTGTGIAQYLTSRSDITKDCIRWYDGDPTNGSSTAPVLNGIKGWVNFMPPLSRSSFSIANLPSAQYYLVGARMIIPFKDRLCFIGPVVQTSSVGSQVYLQDTVIYSQNGTAFYTASFTGDPSFATTVFNPILVPVEQSATAGAYWCDQTGFGGFITAGIDQPIISVSSNEDVLVMGFNPSFQIRFAYTGNDIIPFNFYIINSEMGTSSTFSTINLDRGIMSRGERGFVITSQTQTNRFDLEVPDEVFQISLLNNGNERFCAQRDFINEWVYFTYPSNEIAYKFPNQTLQYNYRDDSWAIMRECYTTYGSFRKQSGFTWQTVGTVYPTWSAWNAPWNAGASTLLQPEVIGGNQQGFIMVRDDGTNEGNSLYIRDIVAATVTSPDHCLNNGDYIVISGALGTVAAEVNGKIFSVSNPTTNTFVLNPPLSSGFTYLGGGVIKRMYVPFIQSKQFPPSWGLARKTRLGPQQYLLTSTSNGEITLLIYLSQNADDAYNAGPIVPLPNSVNNSLIYSTVLYTCVESCNLGLTPANSSLQMIANINQAGTNAYSPQAQIWHRVNTSLVGDTVQVGFTLSDAQMRDTFFRHQFTEIEFHGFILDVNPSQVLA